MLKSKKKQEMNRVQKIVLVAHILSLNLIYLLMILKI